MLKTKAEPVNKKYNRILCKKNVAAPYPKVIVDQLN